MKLSLRKIFDIVIASLGLLLFIFMFIPYFGNDFYKMSMWKFSTAMSVFMLLNVLGIMAVYLLHLFGVLKDKWMVFANYAVGGVTLWHVAFLFHMMDATRVGIWLGTFVTLAMFVISILWNLLGGNESKANTKKITGYDPKTGKPIYE